MSEKGIPKKILGIFQRNLFQKVFYIDISDVTSYTTIMNYIALWYTSIVLTFASVGEVFGQELANNLSESTDTKGNKRKQAVILPEQTLTKHYSDYEVRAQLGLFHLSDEYVKSLLDKLILHLQQIKP
jgi:L-amino acid N-acyltransferase YncA